MSLNKIPPKSKITLSDSKKYELCLFADANNKMTRKQYVDWIEQKWGDKVNESTITRILKKKEEILNTQVTNPNVKRHKNLTVPQLELALKEFVLINQNRAILSEAILIEKAKQIANGLGVEEGTLKYSAGWLHRFKKRNGIQEQKLQGEASSADLNAITEALPMLKNKCDLYPLERIYNMDETGLFYRLEPDRTLATQRLSGRKKNKERLSIALCTNSDGSHKLKPLIIGKFKKPRCFNNVNLNNLEMKYCNNTKAWMLATTFQDWLQEFDSDIAKKYGSEHVLLILDNCPSHKINGLALSNVDVHFLPPNTTSKIQPMDAGIIMSFKRHYRHLHIKWILNQIEGGEDIKDLKMDVLQAIQFIIKSWEEVSPQTIHNCWRHTNILSDRMNVDLTNPSDDPTVIELSQAITALNLSDAMPIGEYLDNPEERTVYEVPDDDKIVEVLVEMYKEQPEVDANDFEEDDSVEQVSISASEATKNLEIVRAFLLQQENSSEQIKLINSLNRYINLKKLNTMKQPTIDSYF
jgi:transposase